MIIYNAMLPLTENGQTGGVEINDGRIVRVGAEVTGSGADAVDAKGAWLLPGLVDLEWGLGKAQIKKLPKEALSWLVQGGTTTALLLPGDGLEIEDEETLELIASKFALTGAPTVLMAAQATREGRLCDLSSLLSSGASAVAVESDIDANLLLRSAQYAAMHDKPLMVECLSRALKGAGVVHEGVEAVRMGLPGWSWASESSEAARMIEIGRYVGIAPVLMHLSAKESVRLVAEAKRAETPLAAGVCIAHLALDESATQGFNTYAKLSPPLRSAEDRTALCSALKEGVLDYVASGNRFVQTVGKDVPFEAAIDGIASSRLMLPLLFSVLVQKEGMSMARVVEVASTLPARLAGLTDRGTLEVGKRADLVLFDPAVATPASLLPAHSPFAHLALQGRVQRVWINGIESEGLR